MLSKFNPFIIFLFILTSIFRNPFILCKEEEEESPIYYIHFNLSDPQIKIQDENGTEIKELEDQINKGIFHIPKLKIIKEGHSFCGWTLDV